MGPVMLQRAERCLQIRPSDSGRLKSPSPDGPDAAWRVLSHPDASSIRGLLREFVFGEHDCHDLRELIGASGYMGSSRLSPAQIMDAVADLVASGRLVIRESVRHAGLHAKPLPMRAPSVQGPPGEPAFTPASLWRRTVDPDPLPAPPRPVLAEEDFITHSEHDVQAAVLKTAATDGIPFCEVCNKTERANPSSPAGSPTRA